MISLSCGIWWDHSRKSSIPSCDMWSVNFLLMTSGVTGTGMLVNKALASKETKVLSELILFPLRLPTKPLLSFTGDVLTCVPLQNFRKKFSQFACRGATDRYYWSEGNITYMDFW